MSGLDSRNLEASLRRFFERTSFDSETDRKVREAIISPNSFDIWAVLDDRAGNAETSEDRWKIVQIRKQFAEEFAAMEVRRLKEVFGKSVESGWTALISSVAEAVSRSRWRFALHLCEESFSLKEQQKQQLQKIRGAVHAMSQSRWVEANDQILFLANSEFVPALVRGKLIAFAGQIELVIFTNVDRAAELFEKASRLAPREATVLGALGDLALQRKDVVQAKKYYEEAIQVAPSEASGYVGMGDLSENDRVFDVAENWYRRAAKTGGGDSLGYSRLLRLCGQPELFGSRERLVQPLLETIIAIAPEEQCQAHIDAGTVYEKNGDLSRARALYDAAIALDPFRPASYTVLAQLCEKQKRMVEAESLYRKAIEVAPECYDGYWGLTWLYEQQKLWGKALEWYRKTPQHTKQWAGIVRAKIGEMLANLDQYPEAERLLKDALREDKTNETRAVLHRIADDYKTRGRKDDAERLYGEMLDLLGESYRGECHNRLGNLYYHESDYALAAEHYRLAVAQTSSEVIYVHNLAGALRELHDFKQARQELRNAFKVDNDEKKFNRELGLVDNAEGNYNYSQGHYREAIENYRRAALLLKDDAIVQSNLAVAWEHLNDGNRSESMNQAIEALEQAHRLAPGGGYGKKAESLRRRLDLARRYGERVFESLGFATPIRVDIASNLVPLSQGVAEGGLSENLSKSIANLKLRVRQEFGVNLPGIRFRDDGTLGVGGYVISLMDVPLVSGLVPNDQRFVPGTAEKLGPHELTGSQGSPGNFRVFGVWVDEKQYPKATSAGLELWDPMEYVIRHLEAVLRFNLSDFVGHQEVASLLVELSQEKLDSFQSTSEKLSALTAVCKGLLVERVSITPFSEVCGVFEELYSPSASGQRIVESVRAQKRNLLPDSSDCVLLPTGPRVEAAMRSCVYRAGERSLVAMEPALCQSVLSAVRKQVPAGQATICVEDPEIRPLFRLVTEMEFPAVSVLSRRELQPGLETDASRRIELEEFEAAEQPGFATLPPVLIETKHPSAVESELSPEPEIVVFVNQTLISNRALADDHSLYETFPLIQEGLFSELGILLPTVRLEADGSLAPNQFRFTLNGVSSAIYPGLAPIDYLVNDTADRLRLLGIEGRAGLNPATGKASAIVSEETTPSETCRQAGLTTWGPVGFLTLVLSRDIRRAAASFQTFSVTKYILESLGALHPHLVDAAMKQFSIEQIMGTLRDLLDEEISIRDLRTILESLLSVGTAVDVDLTRYIVFVPPADRLLPARGGMSRVLTVADYSNWARCALKRYLSHKYSKGNSTLAVYLIAPEIEQRLADLHVRPLTEHEVARLIKAVKEEVGSIPPASSQNPVLLTSIEVRKQLRDLLKKDYPDLAVLSYQELSPELNIQPIARISWE